MALVPQTMRKTTKRSRMQRELYARYSSYRLRMRLKLSGNDLNSKQEPKVRPANRCAPRETYRNGALRPRCQKYMRYTGVTMEGEVDNDLCRSSGGLEPASGRGSSARTR